MKVSILLLASGRGTRLGSDVPKAFVLCAGRPLLLWSLARLVRIAEEREVIVAVHPEDRDVHVPKVRDELERLGVDRLVDGGATRQESMRLALAASSDECSLVLVHDAARPFPPVEAARSAVARAARCGAALLAVPAPDTLKRVDADGRVVETLDRDTIWLAQTPQVARRELWLAAVERADADGFTATDDVSLLEHAGIPVEVVAGSAANRKITTAEDLELAALWARARPS